MHINPIYIYIYIYILAETPAHIPHKKYRDITTDFKQITHLKRLTYFNASFEKYDDVY